MRWLSGDVPIYLFWTQYLLEGNLEPLWFDGDSVPQQLVDHLPDKDEEVNDSDLEYDDEAGDMCYSSESEEEL